MGLEVAVMLKGKPKFATKFTSLITENEYVVSDETIVPFSVQ